MFHFIAKEQFAGVGNRLTTRNKAKIPFQSILNNRVFVDFTAQIVSKSGAARRSEGLMEPGSAQIRVNQQYPTVWLTDDGLSQIRGNEGFPFRRDAAGDQQFLQLLGSRNLVQTRAQGPQAFGANAIAIIANENAIPCVQRP